MHLVGLWAVKRIVFAEVHKQSLMRCQCAGSSYQQDDNDLGIIIQPCCQYIGLLGMAVATYVTLVVSIRYIAHYAYRVFLYLFPPLPALRRKERRRQVLRQRKQDSRARRISGQRTWIWRSYVSFMENRHGIATC